MTYTVVAREDGLVGVATCSHSMFLASKTLHVAADVPAVVVSQAFSSRAIGLAALEDLRSGAGAGVAGREALWADAGGDLRQLLVVAPDGVAVTTGLACVQAAGDGVLPDGSLGVAGNMLADESVVPAMLTAASARPASEGGDLLLDRLLTVLAAGEEAGGDFRGSRSAALVVVGGGAPVSLTVDDSDDPILELRRLREAAHVDAVMRRCMAWLQSGEPASTGLRTDVSALVGRVRTAEAWAILLAEGAPVETTDPLTRRMVAAFASIRDRPAARYSK